MIDWGEEHPLSRGHNAAIKLKFDVLKRGTWAPKKNIINEKIDTTAISTPNVKPKIERCGGRVPSPAAIWPAKLDRRVIAGAAKNVLSRIKIQPFPAMVPD